MFVNKKRIVIVAVVILLVLITTFGSKILNKDSENRKQPETGPQIGLKAPDFTLKTLDGQTARLSDFRGKPVIINFWASWCPPCKKEIPEIQKFYEQSKGKVQILAINITFNDKLSDVQNILRANNAQFSVLLDENEQSSVADAYQVDGIPASFFIDKNGVIREIHVGGMTLDMLQEAVRKAE
jgi:peroxiredoxin